MTAGLFQDLHRLVLDVSPIANWLIATGFAGAACKAAWSAFKKKRRGISARDGKRRLDLVGRLTAALAYAHRLREVLLEHDVPASAIPRWPHILRDQEQS